MIEQSAHLPGLMRIGFRTGRFMSRTHCDDLHAHAGGVQEGVSFMVAIGEVRRKRTIGVLVGPAEKAV